MEEIKTINVPNDMAKTVFSRISIYIEKYHREKMIAAKYMNVTKTVKEFDLKALCASCYTQGLIDAQEIKKHQK